MTTTRTFTCEDLLRFNNINLDVLTETYAQSFYLTYLATWPGFQKVQESVEGRLMGYVLGKAEGKGALWHGHVTAVTVAPEFRRLGLARNLMNSLENISETVYNAYFVDLFVRQSNSLAISMYESFGYQTHRRVLDYYSGEEDALDMRKSLARDPTKNAMIPLKNPITPAELEW